MHQVLGACLSTSLPGDRRCHPKKEHSSSGIVTSETLCPLKGHRVLISKMKSVDSEQIEHMHEKRF